MENKPKSKAKTFNDWLEILSKAAEGVTDNTMPGEKALTLSRITESAMKVINTAVNVAQMQKAPDLLSGLIGARGADGLIVEEEDVPREIASPETKSKMRAELVIVERSLERDDISPVRRAFMEEKKNHLKKALSLIILFIALAGSSSAQSSVTLAWDPSPGTNVISDYKIYYGVESGVYTNSQSAGTNLTLVISNLVQGQTYYYIATATTPEGWESGPSNIVTNTVPLTFRRQLGGSVSSGNFRM